MRFTRTRIALFLVVASIAGACSSDPTTPDVAAPSPTSSAGSPTPSPGSASPSPTTDAEPIVRVAVKGDFGDGTRPQHEITRRMCAARKRRPFTTVITTGDNFYEPDGHATRANYFDPERCLIQYEGHRWRASWGNHDARGASTRTILGARRWYAWSLGGVDFIALNTNRAGDREQRDWLERQLKESTADVKIVYFHAPLYTVGHEHPNFTLGQRMWGPLFERYNVTIVLAGHSHLYEHSRVRGIDHVVTGGGGRFLHRCARKPSTLITCKREHHFLLLEIQGKTVHVEAIARSGAVIDRITIRA